MKRLLPLLLLILSFSVLNAQVSPKRGMAYGYHSKTDLDKVSQGISWWYNWSPKPDVAIKDYYSSLGVEFVPMAWNDNFSVDDILTNIPAGAKYILAYNEPNFNVEANMTPAQAAAVWYKIEQVAAARNLQIVSAAAAYCGGSVCLSGYTSPIKWHDDFFAACPTCKVDYIAFHNYENTTGGLLALVNNLKKYNRPLWITEFAYWDPAVANADKISYLQTAVSAFENDPDIYRYSWFTGRSTSNPSVSLLGNDGVLTSLGDAYINANYGPVNTIPGKIEVEEMYRRKGTAFENTSDTGGGQNVGYTDAGTWNEYLVNIGSTGSYSFKFRVASNVATGKFNISIDDQLIKSDVSVASSGGWQNWVDYTVNGVVLPKGQHLLKFDFTGNGTNMNYFTTTYESPVPPSVDFSASTTTICPGNKIVFTDLTSFKTGDETYSWDFGVGASPATASTVGPHAVTYATAGKRTVSLKVTNANGSDTETKTNYINITSPSAACLVSDDFNDNTVSWILPTTGPFTHSESGTNWKVTTNGNGEWDNFTYSLNDKTAATALNFQCASNKPIVTIRVKASSNCFVRLTMMDAHGRTIDNTDIVNLELTTSYKTFTLNFKGKFRNYNSGNPGPVDSTSIQKLQFYINPGFYSYPYTGTNGTYNKSFVGSIDIDWLGVGDNCSPLDVISGPDAVDAGTTYTYSVVGSGVMEWTVPSGATILSGQGSNTIYVSFTPGANGLISVSNGESSVTKNILINTATGVSKGEIAGSYFIAPNPFEDQTFLNVQSINASNISIRILDTHGMSVYYRENVLLKESILLGQALANGIYTVVISSEDKVYTSRIVKLK